MPLLAPDLPHVGNAQAHGSKRTKCLALTDTFRASAPGMLPHPECSSLREVAFHVHTGHIPYTTRHTTGRRAPGIVAPCARQRKGRPGTRLDTPHFRCLSARRPPPQAIPGVKGRATPSQWGEAQAEIIQKRSPRATRVMNRGICRPGARTILETPKSLKHGSPRTGFGAFVLLSTCESRLIISHAAQGAAQARDATGRRADPSSETRLLLRAFLGPLRTIL